WSPDGRHAVSVGADGSVRLLEVDLDADPVAITQLAVQQDADQENAVRWARGGNPLVTGTWWTRHVVQVWNVDVAAGTLELQSEFVDHPTGINTMEWSGDRQRIVTGGHDDTMRLAAYDGAVLTTMAVLEDHDSGVHSVAWSRDEAYMIMASSMVDRIALIDMRACPAAAGD
ncbi:MAG TPA: WD40 repeat domain-containing protein, partial [Kofleriaceae bacterium]|nr:WD40 repeat domain-containing protein [Kofleriaceae bacterium]